MTMNGDEYVTGKSKDELLRALMTDGQVGSPVWEQQRMGIFVRCTQDIADAIHDFTRSNNRVSAQLLVLNIVLGIFTILGTVLTVWSLIKTTS